VAFTDDKPLDLAPFPPGEMHWKPRIDAYIPGEVRQNRLGPVVDVFTAGEETYIASI
jgi:hypothetical protein